MDFEDMLFQTHSNSPGKLEGFKKKQNKKKRIKRNKYFFP